MTKRHTPPGRKSWACVVVVKPFGPHHCARCFGSVHTENTNARGASNTREPMIERGSRSRSILFFTVIVFYPLGLFRLGLQYLQVVVEPIEPLFPESAILLEPLVGFPKSAHIDSAGTHLRIPATRDESGALEDLQVLGNRRKAHVERLGELQHGRLAKCEPREDCPPRRVGEGCEGAAETIGRHVRIKPSS